MAKKIKVILEIDVDELQKLIESSSNGLLKVDRKKLESLAQKAAISPSKVSATTVMSMAMYSQKSTPRLAPKKKK